MNDSACGDVEVYITLQVYGPGEPITGRNQHFSAAGGVAGAWADLTLAFHAAEAADFVRTRECAERAARGFEAAGEPAGHAHALLHLARCEVVRGDFEAAQRAHPRQDARHVVIHAQMARDDQLDRMAELGVIPSFFSLHTYYWGDRHREIFMGSERA